jgi:hypothetical protein
MRVRYSVVWRVLKTSASPLVSALGFVVQLLDYGRSVPKSGTKTYLYIRSVSSRACIATQARSGLYMVSRLLPQRIRYTLTLRLRPAVGLAKVSGHKSENGRASYVTTSILVSVSLVQTSKVSNHGPGTAHLNDSFWERAPFP